MTDNFINVYGRIRNGGVVLDKSGISTIARVIIRFLANLVLPIYFSLNRKNAEFEITEASQSSPLLIVSLTTYPARIRKIWLVIECLLRQTHKPDKIVLWLSRDQFPSKAMLPRQLLRLEKRGLEIILCDGDLKSHKKYFYTLKKFPEDVMVTIDDDFFYPSTLLGDLLRLHTKHPNAICCERAHLMKVENGELSPYGSWNYLFDGSGPSFEIFQTSGGGTLYPPKSLHPEVLNKGLFLEHCKTADDVWLNVMSQLNSTKVIKSDNYFEMLPILFKSSTNLSSVNVQQGQNDIQIRKIRNVLKDKFQIDPFQNLLSKKW